jgi:hypothetical protein
LRPYFDFLESMLSVYSICRISSRSIDELRADKGEVLRPPSPRVRRG